MNDNSIYKNRTLENFLQILSQITDVEYQKRVWIEARGPEYQDFDGAVCDFFDLGEALFNRPKDFGITDNQYQLLIRFRDIFEKFSDEHDLPQEFIESPEWKKIMQMAKEILQAFNYPENPT